LGKNVCHIKHLWRLFKSHLIFNDDKSKGKIEVAKTRKGRGYKKLIPSSVSDEDYNNDNDVVEAGSEG